MKYFLIFIIALLLFSCSKQKQTCYECKIVRPGRTDVETHCGNKPTGPFPDQNGNAALSWRCEEK